MAQPTRLHSGRPTAPEFLGTEERALFDDIVRNYALKDEASITILTEALASLQRARLARVQIDSEGMTFPNGKYAPKIHPLLPVERDARAAALAGFRQLNLELPRTLAKRNWA
jgi:hypothetical protein